MSFFIPKIVRADDGNTLYYYSKTSMTPTKISLDVLDKMTFGSNGIQMWGENVFIEIPFGEFLLFTFNEIEHPSITPVESVFPSQDYHIKYIAANKTLLVESDNNLNGIGVYDLQGRTIYNDTSTDNIYHINLSAAHQGIFIVKIIRNGIVSVIKIAL